MIYLVTKCILNDDGLLFLFPTESFDSMNEIYNISINYFDNPKIYETKEEGSNERFIKCVSDNNKYIHIKELLLIKT